MQQESSAGAGVNGATGTGSGLYLQPGGEPLTDEQILGLEPTPAPPDGGTVAQGAPMSGRQAPQAEGVGGPEDFSATDQAETASGPPASASAEGEAPQGPAESSAAAEPAWLKALDAQPEAAAEARRWRQAAQDAATLDADYFSADPGARAGLAARLHESDPAAFRSMLADAARLLAERDPQGLAELARQLGAAEPQLARGAARSVAQAARSSRAPSAGNVILSEAKNLSGDSHAGAQRDSSGLQNGPQNDTMATNGSAGAFPAGAYRQFAAAMNDDVERQVRDSIDRALTATLPDGIADGARRRIGDDIFRDLNSTLSADRELSATINDLLRGWRFDAATRRQVAGLLAGRARTVLPEVARRVVSEWTSSVLASDRAKNARIESAASRRDVTGGRLPEPLASSALRPRQVDYTRTSDEQILEM